MSSILNKFKNKITQDTPNGIKLENTSFGQSNGSYQPPIIPVVQLSQSNQPRQKGRPGGGWDDEPQSKPDEAIIPNNKATNSINLLNDTPPKQNEQKINHDILLPPQPAIGNIQVSRITLYKKGQLLTYEELEQGGFDYEFHFVDEVIKLGGIKLKQSDTVLKEFAKSISTIQEQLVGSILLNKLHSEENWKVQIRCIYAIQFVSQQFQNYREFFQINQQYLRVETDQQLLSQAIDQTLAEINGQQISKQKDFQFEFREPPKPQQFAQNQQPNLIDILDVSSNDSQQQKQQQQKLNLKQLKIKQPNAETQQQPLIQQQLPQSQQQQPQIQQQNQQKNAQQINLLDAFSDLSLQNYHQEQIQSAQSYTQQPQQQQQQQQNGISFDDLLNQQGVNQQQAQPKKNAFGFIKKDQQQQQTLQNTQQSQEPLNLLNSPQQQYQQSQINQQIPQQQPQYFYNQSQSNQNQQIYLQPNSKVNVQQQSQSNKKDLIDFLNL